MKTFSMPADAAKGDAVPCVLCGCENNFAPALECEGFSFVKCRKCGLVQMNPQLSAENIISRYSSTYGKDYLSYELANEESFLKLQQLALKDAGFAQFEKKLFNSLGSSQSGDRSGSQNNSSQCQEPKVIDIGCATGSLINYLREKKWQVTGVEISPCAEYARKERGLDVRSVPLEENNFPDSHFDALLASHLIEHLNNPMSFLKEAYRVLKPGGHVFITTPNINGFQAHVFKGRWRSAIFDHLYLFSNRTLIKMLKIAGFKIKSIHTWGGLAAGAASPWLKKIADFLAKRLNCGDVMIVNAVKE